MESSELHKVRQNCEAVRSSIDQSEERLRFFKHEINQEAGRKRKLRAKVIQLDLMAFYLRVATKYRKVLSKYHIWNGGALLTAPPAIALLFFIFYDMLTDVRSVSVVLSGVVFILAIVALLVLSKYPPDSELPQEISKSKNELTLISDKISQIQTRIEDLERGLEQESALNANMKQQLRELEKISSIRFHCQQLFNENWRAMRSVEFEQYLERVFKLLGYNTQTTNTTGDQGVDLIVERAGHRIAVQVKGYLNSVSNSAIQEAFAGMRHYNCHSCAVITNSGFTQSAIDLAASTNCFLIHEDNFREFVFGELTIG